MVGGTPGSREGRDPKRSASGSLKKLRSKASGIGAVMASLGMSFAEDHFPTEPEGPIRESIGPIDYVEMAWHVWKGRTTSRWRGMCGKVGPRRDGVAGVER